MLETKEEIRSRILKNRYHDAEKDALIYKNLIASDEFISHDIILTYVPKSAEISTKTLIEYCFGAKKKVFVPKTSVREIEFYEINGFGDLEKGKFGVFEPKPYCERINSALFRESLCVVPALACNREKHRIGYGKGYYDRFLEKYDGVSVALCYGRNIADFSAFTGDIAVNFVISENGRF